MRANQTARFRQLRSTRPAVRQARQMRLSTPETQTQPAPRTRLAGARRERPAGNPEPERHASRRDPNRRRRNRTARRTARYPRFAHMSRRQSKLPAHYRDAAPLHQGVQALILAPFLSLNMSKDALEF